MTEAVAPNEHAVDRPRARLGRDRPPLSVQCRLVRAQHVDHRAARRYAVELRDDVAADGVGRARKAGRGRCDEYIGVEDRVRLLHRACEQTRSLGSDAVEIAAGDVEQELDLLADVLRRAGAAPRATAFRAQIAIERRRAAIRGSTSSTVQTAPRTTFARRSPSRPPARHERCEDFPRLLAAL